ncbi:MAG: NADH-quinone oxidoreductase subunit C [Pseudomonadota bacterium]
MTAALKELATYLAEKQSDAVISHAVTHGELTVEITAQDAPRFVEFLKADRTCAFSTLIDITAVDYPTRERRFDLVWHLLSMYRNQRLRVRAHLRETEIVPSIIGVHPSANWYEREVFDMFGIMFSGHPDLRRILTDYGFRGHPLRKDFPTTGFTEVRYDEELKRVVYEPVSLTQEYRQFDFMSPWEGADYVLPGDEKAEGEAT